MKLSCSKCKKVLTEDLYKARVKWGEGIFGGKVIRNQKNLFDLSFHNGFPEGHLKKGLFFEKPAQKSYNNKYDEDKPAQIVRGFPKTIYVSHKSIKEGVIPDFVSGYGCCNYSMGYPLKCSCGNKLGGMFLDCYEDGVVKFVESSVDRIY